MASSLLTVLLIAVATIQVAFATYYSTCDPPRHPDNGYYSPYRSKYFIGSKIRFNCNSGYKLYGPSWTVCRHYNNQAYWIHQPPVCKPIRAAIRCPDLGHPQYGGVKVSGYTHGSTAYYKCNSGYQIVGRAYRSCQNGYWTGKEPACDEIICTDLYDPPYGSVNMTDNTPGSTAHYECDYGFKMVGDAYRKCLYNGYWSGKEPVCKKTIICPDLYDPPYGSVNVTDRTPGSTAHYECDHGLKLVGNAYRECLYSGYWGGKEPVCKRIICSFLVAPKYGKVNMRGNTPPSKAYYSCNYGYKLHGLKWRQCQDNGRWYGDAPVCRPGNRVTCPHLDAPRYGKIRVTGYFPSSKAYYSCNNGYKMYGLQWRQCRYDGKWYGKAPVCHSVKNCPRLDAPRYGKVRVTGYTPSSKAYYSCDYGYKLYGLKWRKCQYDGSWYGSAPYCRPVKY